MHSKLQLLKFADRLRVVIPTGNLVPYDWGETGVMENVGIPLSLPGHSDIILLFLSLFGFLSFSILTRGILVLVYVQMVFLIDLPRLEDPAVHPPQTPTGFYTELVYFLQATGVGEKMVASLSNYDFSKTSDIAFVHTMCVLSRDAPERGRGTRSKTNCPSF